MNLPKNIVEKAKRLDAVRRLNRGLEKEEKELADVLRPYVEEKGKDNARGCRAVWNDEVEVYLESYQKLEVDPEELYKSLKKKAFEFFAVKVKELKQAIKDEVVKMNEEQLENLAYHGEGTPRVKVEIKAEK